MKCPRCSTNNESRNVCSKCGYFLYHPEQRGARKLSKQELKDKDKRMVFSFVKKAGKVIWYILMIIIFTFWVFMIMYLFVLR